MDFQSVSQTLVWISGTLDSYYWQYCLLPLSNRLLVSLGHEFAFILIPTDQHGEDVHRIYKCVQKFGITVLNKIKTGTFVILTWHQYSTGFLMIYRSCGNHVVKKQRDKWFYNEVSTTLNSHPWTSWNCEYVGHQYFLQLF